MSLNLVRRRGLAGLAFLGAAILAAPSEATSVRQMNVVDLLEHSATIVAGNVEKVSDGFDANGVPYTEVTLKVTDPIRGAQGDHHTFRQYGLTTTRKERDGRILMAGAPEGWPTWHVGETAVVFLYPKAKQTGLQTTVGLGYGKMSVGNGRALNGYDNEGLFRNVKVKSGVLTDEERAMFTTVKGPVDAEALRGMLRRAVAEKWVESGRISNAKR